MSEAVGQALEQALATYRAPAQLPLARARELPPDVLELLRIAGGDEAALAQGAAASGDTPEAVQDAAVFYIQQVLFAPGADSYRVLGVGADAPDAQLKEHYRWLVRWLHPDRNRDEWEAVYADRVNRAWQDLRQPERRAAYDRDRTGAEEGADVGHGATLASAAVLRALPESAGPLISSRTRRRLPLMVFVGLGAVAGAGLALLWVAQMPRQAPRAAAAAPVEQPDALVVQAARGVPPAPGAEVPATPASVPAAPLPGPAATVPEATATASTDSAPIPVSSTASADIARTPASSAASAEIARRPVASAPSPSPSPQASALPASAPPQQASALPESAPPPSAGSAAVASAARTAVPGPQVAAVPAPAASPAPDRPPSPTTASRAPDGPSAAPATATARATAPLPAPAPALAQEAAAASPAPELPASAAISQAEADAVLKAFTLAYARGDITTLMLLFTRDARNNRGGRDAIAYDYQSLFSGSEWRELELVGTGWMKRDQGATVLARYQTRVGLPGRRRTDRSEGDIRFDLRREDGVARISLVRHDPDDG